MIPLILLAFLQQPKVEFQSPIAGRVGQYVVIKPTQLNGKAVKYFTSSPGLEVFPSDLLADKTATVVSSVLPGKYTLIAYTALGDIPSDPALIEVIIGNPSPNPTPPSPPQPQPENDPLMDSLLALWGALEEPNKLQSRDKLAQIYRQSAAVYRDPAFASVGQAFQRSKEISRSLLPDSALNSLRVRIGEELKRVVPVDPSMPLTQDLRGSVASQLDRMAKLVESLR